MANCRLLTKGLSSASKCSHPNELPRHFHYWVWVPGPNATKLFPDASKFGARRRAFRLTFNYVPMSNYVGMHGGIETEGWPTPRIASL